MSQIVKKSLSMPYAAKLLLAANALALLFVAVMQFGVGLTPCVLCLWQRVPYTVALILSFVAWFWKPYQRHTVTLLAFCFVAYVTNTGLAFFHTGVEQHWWLGTSGCAIEPLQGKSIDDLRESLLTRITPRCDEVTWTIFGLSMANLNVVFSLLLALFAGAATLKASSHK